MAALKETLELARRREQAEAWDKNEAGIAARLLMDEGLPPPPNIDEQTRADLQPFLSYTTTANVRYCPSKPLTVAAFVLAQAATGTSTDQLLRQLSAISTLHDRHNLASPVGTHAVRAALESVTGFEPPRSWKTPEKEQFLLLPAEIKAAVSRREQQREKELQRLQDELAAIKRQNQKTAPDVKPVIETTQKEGAHRGHGFRVDT